jgi:hypothetical protein
MEAVYKAGREIDADKLDTTRKFQGLELTFYNSRGVEQI